MQLRHRVAGALPWGRPYVHVHTRPHTSRQRRAGIDCIDGWLYMYMCSLCARLCVPVRACVAPRRERSRGVEQRAYTHACMHTHVHTCACAQPADGQCGTAPPRAACLPAVQQACVLSGPWWGVQRQRRLQKRLCGASRMRASACRMRGQRAPYGLCRNAGLATGGSHVMCIHTLSGRTDLSWWPRAGSPWEANCDAIEIHVHHACMQAGDGICRQGCRANASNASAPCLSQLAA